jgi:hypothetical protein
MGKFGRVVLKVRDQNKHPNSLFKWLYLLPDNLGWSKKAPSFHLESSQANGIKNLHLTHQEQHHSVIFSNAHAHTIFYQICTVVFDSRIPLPSYQDWLGLFCITICISMKILIVKKAQSISIGLSLITTKDRRLMVFYYYFYWERTSKQAIL